jgi:YHS domain-containing protein
MRRYLLASFCFLFFLAGTADAQTPALRQKHYNLSQGLALDGYDPVSYFKGKPKQGSSKFNTVYNGVTYRFANEDDLNAFKKNPAGYEPMYGGWCAYAMGANGEKVEVDPETYKIIEGKLYLFYNKYFNNTLKTWNKNEVALHAKADANWQKIFK